MEVFLLTICGTGLAGLRVAGELRERGYSGPIRAIDREGVPPYDRPPLTKELFGNYRRPLSAEGLGQLSELVDEVIHGTVSRVEGTTVCVRNTSGIGIGEETIGEESNQNEEVAYQSDSVVLALGADARNMFPGALTIRTREDADKLRAVTGPVTIVGGSWLGCELSSSFVQEGHEVTLVEIADSILPTLGKEASAPIARALEDMGVTITNTLPEKHGTLVEATGAIQNTLGLDLTTDGWGRTTMPNVYAVGDCATLTTGPTWGHWNTALHQASRVAEAIMTDPTDEPLPLVSDVFSTIANKELLFIGRAEGTPVTLEDGSRTLWILNDQLTGGFTIDRPADGVALRRNLGHPLTPDAAADPRPLKKILRG